VIREQAKFSFKRVAMTAGLLTLLLVTTCCQPDRPKGVLTEREMVRVLTRIYLAEEKISRASIHYDSVKRILPYFREQIFEDVGVEDSVFRESWNYYLDHPDRLEAIYTALIDSLNLKEQGSPTTSSSKSDAVPD